MRKICISRDWSLCAPGTNGWKKIDLPNDYAITLPRDPHAAGGAANGFFQGRDGTYRKDLILDAEPGHYILDIDGAYMCAAVKLNGTQLVMHPHGYAPLLVDLTDRAKKGVENHLEIITHGFQPSTRWYSGAGIYRDVYMWAGGDIRVEPWDLFVSTPDTETVIAAYEISSDKNDMITLRAEILDEDGEHVSALSMNVKVTAGEKTPLTLSFRLPDAKLWSPDTPYLYNIRTSILDSSGKLTDTDERSFGVRTISADAKHGLLINGEPMKLRGGCIHHDHAVLGAADYPAACHRKLTKLREAGFNALRIAHNPPSTTLLDLCDRMGIIVMDEAFDTWALEKGGRLNYHMWFADWWQRDIAAMVKRDRSHPCVISYSIGNEIPESDGLSNGDELSAALSTEIRKYDGTRLVTSAVWGVGGPQTWAERTKGYFAPLDICGYNYLYSRYKQDHELFPERVIWGSETHALHFYDSWHTVLECSYAIGDFTWTAYDNLGEAGTGNFMWARDGHIPGIKLFGYPWRSCYQGDLDLCGYRRPQSYFREAVWIGDTEPKIFTTHPEHYGEGFSGTGWHWYDVHEDWTFGDKYVGKPVRCEVYTDADEIEFILNGRSLGRTKPEKAIAFMDINYEKGELVSVAYKNGEECGRSALHTVGAPSAVKVEAESRTFQADGRDLCYFDISIVDKNGDRVVTAKNKLSCLVDGGELLGFFSADPANDDQYGSNECHAFDGRAVAIVRTKKAGQVRLIVGGDNLGSGSDTVAAE